ncbi:MAG TPA: hypothetical protein ENK18_04600 [Deltaproteobacteria bacterium]|nr:hypothetical protein [Deltaproteobacteria bacterium]
MDWGLGATLGLGASRELKQQDRPQRPLEPELHERLTTALDKLDQLNPAFKASRDEERGAQMVKLWNRTCKDIDAHLRTLAKVLIDSHQLSLDMGSDGGGRGTRPWLEETSMAFQRLIFRLEDETVLATTGDRILARGSLDEVTYDWVQSAVVAWVVTSVEQHT